MFWMDESRSGQHCGAPSLIHHTNTLCSCSLHLPSSVHVCSEQAQYSKVILPHPYTLDFYFLSSLSVSWQMKQVNNLKNKNLLKSSRTSQKSLKPLTPVSVFMSGRKKQADKRLKNCQVLQMVENGWLRNFNTFLLDSEVEFKPLTQSLTTMSVSQPEVSHLPEELCSPLWFSWITEKSNLTQTIQEHQPFVTKQFVKYECKDSRIRISS